jgi:hypothetical protein
MSYVRYIDKTTAYYRSQGYDQAYQWAHFEDVPFTPLDKPLRECKIGMLSTSELAVRFDPETEDDPIVEEGFRSIYCIDRGTPIEKLYSRTSSFDAAATSLEDVNSFFPISAAEAALAAGRIGELPDRWYGAYNNYSQRKVLEEEAPKVLELCRADEIEAIVLVPV